MQLSAHVLAFAKFNWFCCCLPALLNTIYIISAAQLISSSTFVPDLSSSTGMWSGFCDGLSYYLFCICDLGTKCLVSSALSSNWPQFKQIIQYCPWKQVLDFLSEICGESFLITLSVFTPSITSYQTLPRNMPSHRAQIVPRYPEGYRTLPRNSMMRPDSICSVAGSVYDRALRPASTTTVTTAEKRRSMRDDTMWQLYEWQQRQAFSRQSLAQPTGTHTPGWYNDWPSVRAVVFSSFKWKFSLQFAQKASHPHPRCIFVIVIFFIDMIKYSTSICHRFDVIDVIRVSLLTFL